MADTCACTWHVRAHLQRGQIAIASTWQIHACQSSVACTWAERMYMCRSFACAGSMKVFECVTHYLIVDFVQVRKSLEEKV